MSKYDKLKQTNTKQAISEKSKYEIANKELDDFVAEADRTTEVYHHAEQHLDDIELEFETATGLNKVDVSVLMLAIALQIGRWVLLGAINGVVSDQLKNKRIDHNDKSITDMEKGQRNNYRDKHSSQKRVKSKKHRDWENIVFEGVPYDITRGSIAFDVNMEGGYHRTHTLGHDPVLGWIFGTIDIISDTITLDNSRVFDVDMDIPRHWKKETSAYASVINAYDSIEESQYRLPAAVFAQALHYKSDVLTKNGLPIPILERFSQDFASKIYKEGYDSLCLMKDIAIVGSQAALSVFINMLISLIHGLFYDSNEIPNRDLFDVKTRKILMWSNVIASSLNLTAVIGVEGTAFISKNPDLAKKGFQYLDVGGYIVTMYRLVSDKKFINNVKSEFLKNEWERLVVGDDFSFTVGGQTE